MEHHFEWLDTDFINKCIHSKVEYRKLTAISLTVEPAVPPGNNFGSCILRVKAKLKEEHVDTEHVLSLIVKAPLAQGTIKEIFESVNNSEPMFYNSYLPFGFKLLSFSYTPQSFTSPIPSVIVLEDLKEKGYMMLERTKQLDLEHCQSYVVAAAKFHATSFAVHKKNPKLIYSMAKENMFSNDFEDTVLMKIGKNIIKYSLDCMADYVSKSTSNLRLERIIRYCSDNLWNILVEAVKPNESFNTFNQGDPWTTNMMFKYDEYGKVCDTKLLDFQNLRFASPITDLVFFIWSSANGEVLKTRQEDVFEMYLQNLNIFLKQMNFEETLSKETAKEHALKLSPLALWVVSVCLPIMLKSTVTDLDSLYSKCKIYNPKQNPFKDLYTEEYCRNNLPGLLEQMQVAQVFDYLENMSM